MLQVWPVEILGDNYVWVLEREGSDRVALVDPGDGAPVLAALERRGLTAAAVLLTHHHHDHVGGLPAVIERHHPAVWGAAADGVAGVDCPIGDGDRVPLPFLDLELEVIALPGHTATHLGFVGPGIALVGDTLFAGGCGRVLGGTFEQLHRSLARLAALPSETKAYCAHEYTVANLGFARHAEPGNAAIVDRLAAAQATREAGLPTVPSTVGYELETNVFLRCSAPGVVASASARAGRDLAPGVETFRELRTWKDGWRG
ncbi:MAG: hydroxyacylglutathione hydrolase [Thermoanaerobaculales bacterium]|jgi:hydroxyacylglutathione hydrolase|nr:hydroxyacylglutathione hydrolase [Thermoanaerobaculales bacterium]